MFLDHSVQDRLLGLMAAIGRPRRGHAPHRRHARQRCGGGTGRPFIRDRRECRRSDARARGARNPTAAPLALPAHARRCRNNVHERWEWQDRCRTEPSPAGSRRGGSARPGLRGEGGSRISHEVSVHNRRHGSSKVSHSEPEFGNRATRPPNADGCVHHFATESREGESFTQNPSQQRPRPVSLVNAPGESSTRLYRHGPAGHPIRCA